MRKITSIVTSLILLVSLSVCASAAATRTFLIQEYDIVSDEIYCYGIPLPERGELEVSAGSLIIENAELSTLEQEKIPVTVYCLVDSSTSQTDKMARQREDLLLTLSSLMGAEDSMVLATINDDLAESKPLTTQTARDTAITTITGQTWYTRLYDGISDALKALHTNTSYNKNRCLVILSDGHDDGKSSVTAKTIQQQIAESGIPVYTVVLNNHTISDKEIAQQRQFAESSLGGFYIYPDQDGVSASVAGQRIWNNIKGSSVIQINTQELLGASDDQQLLIRYDSEDTRYEDTILIRAVDLPALPTEPSTEETEPTVEEEETTAQTEEPTDPPVDPEGESHVELLLACGIGAVLLIVGIAAFFLSRKKSKSSIKEDAEADFPVTDGGPEPPVLPDDDIPEEDSHMEDYGSTIPVTMPTDDRLHVFAVALMHADVRTDFYLTQNIETTFGRTTAADLILNGKDMKLSSCNGCFLWNGKMLFVQDRQSRNGTAVNGEACSTQAWLKLENGSVLTAGSYEYRITFNA